MGYGDGILNELSLFSGAGGGLLGTKLLGWKHIGYVEFNKYCQKIIRARIDDGILDEAPIFTDVREFIESGCVDQYRGFVDVVTAGFPCQPFSVAGKQQGEDDPRNMWPQTIDIIRRVQPRYAFLENVPGLTSPIQRWLVRLIPSRPGWFGRLTIKACFPSYFGHVLGSMAESGFDVKWRVLSAAEVGAPHKRDRIWLICHTKYAGRDATEISESTTQGNDSSKTREKQASQSSRSGDEYSELADPKSKSGNGGEPYRKHSQCKTPKSGNDNSKNNIPNPHDKGLQRGQESRNIREVRQEREQQLERQSEQSIWGDCPVEPAIRGMDDGVANRVDRLKALGNGQVSRVVATAWRLLTDNN